MEEEKGVRYDAKKLFLEVCRKWQALIVITLLVAVIFCVISVTSAANAEYEAKEGFVINYPEPSVGEDVLPELAEEVLNFRRTEQRELVASAGDTLANTAYINLFNAMEEAALDGKYVMEGLKENIKVELSNSNRTLTVTVIASSAKDAVFMLDNLEAQVTAEISAAGEGFSAQLTYKDAEEDLDTMYTLEEGGVMSILIAVVEGVVIGFVAAVVILLIWSAIFLRVSYAEDIAMQTDYTVLATVYPGDKGAGEACIKSALVRSKNDKVTYVTGVTKSAGEVASGWAAREMAISKALYIDLDDTSAPGMAEVFAGKDIKEVIKDGTLTAGEGLDVYAARGKMSELIVGLKGEYERIIISGYTCADARSELAAAFADDTALVIDEGYPVKKLIALEEKYKGEGRNIEGVILRKKAARKK